MHMLLYSHELSGSYRHLAGMELISKHTESISHRIVTQRTNELNCEALAIMRVKWQKQTIARGSAFKWNIHILNIAGVQLDLFCMRKSLFCWFKAEIFIWSRFLFHVFLF